MTTPKASEPLKVVLVEDNPDTRYVIASLLHVLGHRVAEFETAEDALAYLASEVAEVLVADVRLPGMSGEIFAVEARAIQPKLGIVFATGLAAYSSSVFDGTTTVLLCKPFGLNELERALACVASVAPALGSVDPDDSIS